MVNLELATFYTFGERLDLSNEVKAAILDRIHEQLPNLVPTTYEASKAYLDEEILKPEGQRDLIREMCMIWALKLPKGRTTVFTATSANVLIPLTDDCMIVYPTIELPPTSFGTRDNPYSNMLADTMTSKPVTARIIMGYFTRAGDKLEMIGDENTMKIQLDSTPFR